MEVRDAAVSHSLVAIVTRRSLFHFAHNDSGKAVKKKGAAALFLRVPPPQPDDQNRAECFFILA